MTMVGPKGSKHDPIINITITEVHIPKTWQELEGAAVIGWGQAGDAL